MNEIKNTTADWCAARLKAFRKEFEKQSAAKSAAFSFDGKTYNMSFAQDIIDYFESITDAAICTRVCPKCSCRIEKRGASKAKRSWSCPKCKESIPPA